MYTHQPSKLNNASVHQMFSFQQVQMFKSKKNALAPLKCLRSMVAVSQTLDALPLIEVTLLFFHTSLAQRICGEVYEADEQLLTFLDKWEKVPELYDRRLIKVTFDSGSFQQGIVCLQVPIPTRRILHHTWSSHQRVMHRTHVTPSVVCDGPKVQRLTQVNLEHQEKSQTIPFDIANPCFWQGLDPEGFLRHHDQGSFPFKCTHILQHQRRGLSSATLTSPRRFHSRGWTDRSLRSTTTQ